MSVQFQALHSHQIDKTVIQEVSDLFRLTFSNKDCNGAWGQFLTNSSGSRIVSPDVIFSQEQFDEYGQIPLHVLDQFDPEENRKTRNWEDRLFKKIDPLQTYKVFKDKFSRPSLLVTVRESNGKLVAFAMGYQAGLKEAFELEEWGHPNIYAAPGNQSPAAKRSYTTFQRCVQPLLEMAGVTNVTPQTPVWVGNCIVVRADSRGKGFLKSISETVALGLTDSALRLPALNEVTRGSLMHRIMKHYGLQEATGILDKELVMMVGSMKKGLQLSGYQSLRDSVRGKDVDVTTVNRMLNRYNVLKNQLNLGIQVSSHLLKNKIRKRGRNIHS